MKNQNQFVQTMKRSMTKVKIALLLIISLISTISYSQNVLYNKVLSTTVTILYVDKGDTNVIGSGVVVSDKMIITCYHVLVGFYEKEIFDGFTYFNENKIENFLIKYNNNSYTRIKSVLGFDKKNDLVLFEPNDKINHFAKITESNINVGDQVFAIGAPYGISNVFTTGIICKNDIADDKLGFNCILSSFQIAGGNSGGGLFNNKGELIAINQASYGSIVDNRESAFSISKILSKTIKQIIINNNEDAKFNKQILFDKAEYLTNRDKSLYILFMDSELEKYKVQLNKVYNSDTNNIEYKKLTEHINSVLEFYRSPSYCHEIANKLWKLDKKESALIYYLYACKYPKYYNITYAMSLIGAAIQLNKYTIAEEHLKEVIRLENDKKILAHAYTAYADVCINTGRREEAINYIKLAVYENFYFRFYETNTFLIDYMKQIQLKSGVNIM